MQGFHPQKRKNNSAESSPLKGKALISPQKAPSQKAQELNQAPDSVPAMTKPGEFVLPPDTVDAVGGPEALNQVVQATHQPVPEAAVVPQGFEPQLFFANGGGVPEDETSQGRIAKVPESMMRRENTTFSQPEPASAPAQQRLPGPRNPEVTAAAMQTPMDSGPVTFSTPQMRNAMALPKPAPTAAVSPAVPNTMQGMASTGFHPNIAAKAERAPAGVPTAAPAAKTSTAGVPVGGGNSPTAMYFDDATADVGRRWNQGDVAGAVGAGLRTAVGTVGMAGVEAIDKTMSPVLDGAGRLFDGLMGSPAQATQSQAATPTAVPAPASAPTATKGPTQSPAPQGSATAQPAAPQAQTAMQPSAASTPLASALPEGVYSHGRGQYSDSAAGMGFSPGFTGQPSAQNLRAAENLATTGARSGMAAESGARQAGGFRAPTVAHSGNDFTSREALRRAKMDATSLIHQSHWANKGSGQAAQERYNKLQAADSAAQAQQGNMDMQAMGFNAQLAREQMGQEGANNRALLGFAGDSARLGLEARRLGGEEQARGIQIRQAQRLEQAQDAYIKAKTPEEQASALATIRALSGKGDGQLKDNFAVLGGGQEYDAQAQMMRNVPQRVVDLRTGQELGSNSRSGGPATPRTKAEYDALPKGTEYLRDGKVFIKS